MWAFYHLKQIYRKLYRFLILLINLKTGATQWRVGVGRQRGTKVRETGERGTGSGRFWPLVHPLHMYSLIHVIIISYLGLLEIETLHLSPQPLNYLVGLRAVSSIQPLCSVWHMTINTSSNNHIWRIGGFVTSNAAAFLKPFCYATARLSWFCRLYDSKFLSRNKTGCFGWQWLA